jgi:hypothetical protein
VVGAVPFAHREWSKGYLAEAVCLIYAAEETKIDQSAVFQISNLDRDIFQRNNNKKEGKI